MKTFITLKEAKELFQECEVFDDGGFVPLDSPLRKKTEEIFHESYVSHLIATTSLVYRVLAQKYMGIDLDKPSVM